MSSPRRPPIVVVTCRDEARRLPATLGALASAFPGARVVVADDGSSDGTAEVARRAGAEVVGGPPVGKGGAATRAARNLIAAALEPSAPTFVLCDGDLGPSARELPALVAAVERGGADLAVAAFANRRGGGFGIAVDFARRAIRRLCGLELRAPISGQRALRAELLPLVVPFAPRFGMEFGMTVDAARAGFRVVEIDLDLDHRSTGRTPAGFLHRGRQLVDFALAYLTRR